MNTVTVVALAALLGAVLLFIVALMMWQESRRRSSRDPTEFIIEDAAAHVSQGLGEETRRRLGADGTLAVIEWHMQWVTERIRAGEPPVLGLTDDAVHYILDKRPDADPADIEAVLTGVSDYVASIGAVGPAF